MASVRYGYPPCSSHRPQPPIRIFDRAVRAVLMWAFLFWILSLIWDAVANWAGL